MRKPFKDSPPLLFYTQNIWLDEFQPKNKNILQSVNLIYFIFDSTFKFSLSRKPFNSNESLAALTE